MLGFRALGGKGLKERLVNFFPIPVNHVDDVPGRISDENTGRQFR
jgi:hypothetical protein